ncbi:hypothetical protein AWM75_08495 [Aerococcus urinaehominis]|uniref:Uncharacterized protein n=1 Tax=Aerococcus urinaehominis TaxID=128944 RepID=A0A0X8FME1_9LACT|nr:GNAT family N-acetyltransferase [Aerococcus urinaehominis]AMC00008.1 hypothetical protein AWM75_08495 [Aerococcus urinaehominis]SDL82099.1 Acetyltransferase (GNAT) family protein [Aerococcus urinaehominis]
MQIRPVRPDQVAQLSQLSISCYQDTFAGTTSDANMQDYLATAYNKDQLAKELGQDHTQFYFVTDGDQILAYFKINWGPEQSEDHFPAGLELERIYVTKSAKGQGIGSLMMAQVHQIAQDLACRHIWLGVWEHNYPAQAFYKKHGFKRFGQHAFIMGDDHQCDWLLVKSLDKE